MYKGKHKHIGIEFLNAWLVILAHLCVIDWIVVAYDFDLTLSSRFSLCVYEILMNLVYSYSLSRLHVKPKAGLDRSGFGMIQVWFIPESGQKIIPSLFHFHLHWVRLSLFFFSWYRSFLFGQIRPVITQAHVLLCTFSNIRLLICIVNISCKKLAIITRIMNSPFHMRLIKNDM